MVDKYFPCEAPMPWHYVAALKKAYSKNQALDLILYGAKGSGKSSYSIQLLMQVYGKETHKWRSFLVFKPEHFISLCWHLYKTKTRVPLVVWDDAGLWLFALDWNDPKVKSAVKLLNVSRVLFSGLIMTTPSYKMIIKKIPQIEGVLMGKIVELGYKEPDKRRAEIYRNVETQWGRHYANPYVMDKFDVMIDDTIWKWYEPTREEYASEDELKQFTETTKGLGYGSNRAKQLV